MPSRRARGRGRGGEARRRGKGPSRHARTRPSARTYPVSAAATSTSDTSRVNAARRVSARFSSSSCRCLVSSSQPASETRKGKTAAGGSDALLADRRTTQGVFVCLSLFPHRVSYERQSHENFVLYFVLFRNFDASRTEEEDISFPLASHSHPTALARRVFTNAAPARRSRLKLVVPRGRTHLSRTSMFGASALSAAPKVHGLPLSKATRKSRVPAARSTGTCALLRFRRANAPRDRFARRAFFRDVVCQAVERSHATQARLLSVASAKKYPPMFVTKSNPAITPSHASAPPPPPPTQASACAPWPPKTSPASGFAASP